MNEIIQRAARAAQDAYENRPAFPTADETWEAVARAVIAAMREPNEAMIKAVDIAEERAGYCASAYENMPAGEVWPIMIDAALRNTPATPISTESPPPPQVSEADLPKPL